jgi:glucose-6-phosphate 1-dehydrogenase
VEAAWTIVDPVLGDPRHPTEYGCGGWGPADADLIIPRDETANH